MVDDKCYLYGKCEHQTAGCVTRPDEGCPVYRYFKGLILEDYKQRLKVEKLALLEELQKEVDELCINNPLSEDEEDMNRGVEKAADVIQEKIDALNKGERR